MSSLISFFLIYIIYYFFKKYTNNSPYALLKKVFTVKHFSNIATIYAYGNFYIIKADANGENHIFGVKNTLAPFTNSEITKLYEYSRKSHTHSVVLVTYNPILPSNPIYTKIKKYGISIWDYKKLLALSESNTSAKQNSSTQAITTTHSILKTSDTSNDTCKIEKNSFNPILNGNLAEGLFSTLFDKPTRL